MSGSNSICVSTVLLETGIITMREPETRFTPEAPGGLVDVSAQCRDGKAQRITVRNVPSFADRLDAHLEVEGIGTLKVDTAYGGVGESGIASSNSRLETKRVATQTAPAGSIFLDDLGSGVDELEGGRGNRATRDRDRLAAEPRLGMEICAKDRRGNIAKVW